MDKTKNRVKKLEACKRSTLRYMSIKGNSRKLLAFLSNHVKSVTTCVLLLLVVGLLFGIASQLSAPATQVAPTGVTTLDYTTFLQQVKAGNIAAVIVQGDEVNGLLRNPIAQTSASQNAHPTDANQAYEAWWHYITTVNNSLSATPASLNTAYFVYTRLPVGAYTQLMPLLLQNHIRITNLPAAQPSPVLALLLRFAPFLLMIAALFFVFLLRNNGVKAAQRMDERITQIGKSRAKRFVRAKEARESDKQPVKTPLATATSNTKDAGARVSTTPSVTFNDVAGIDEVRTELEEIVQFLQRPERFKKLGAHIPRGALLIGPPGTGKTLLARAVAGEAGVPFFSMSASEFVEMFVGVGASRVRDLFDKARQAAPCVIFIDELDAVGRKRSIRIGGNDERDQTLNQLLVELDGFDERHAVVVLAATNRVDILDNALLRPGRFDRRITVSLPDRVGREAILKVHTRTTPLHEDVELARIARLTTGMSGADLANLVNEASLSAARRNLDCVSLDCFEHALARIQLGALRPLVMSEKDRRIIAYHEGGHALVAYHLPEADTVNRVTILPRGQSLGVTHFIAEEDRYNYSRQALMTKIAVALGGRVAEELTFGAEYVTTGAENDLQVVTDLARRMVTRWGMGEEIGVVYADYRAEGNPSLNMRRFDADDLPVSARTFVAHADGTVRPNGSYQLQRHAFAQAATSPKRTLISTTMSALIDAEVQGILNEGRSMAHAILNEHREQLRVLADTLIEQEQLDRAQFEALFD